MAKKRMFDFAVIDSDNFASLPIPAIALYFMLAMNTDDSGFASFIKISKLYDFKKEDLEILELKEFVIIFEDGIIVITHFYQHNWLDGRRITPTQYQKEKSLLILTKQKKYLLGICLADAKREENRIEENNYGKKFSIKTGEKNENSEETRPKQQIEEENEKIRNTKKEITKKMQIINNEKETFDDPL